MKQRITSEGFDMPTKQEIYNDVLAHARGDYNADYASHTVTSADGGGASSGSSFGSDSHVPTPKDIKVKPYSNDDFIANFIADLVFNMYSELNAARASFNLKEATGSALENLARLKSLYRLKPQKSQVKVELVHDDRATADYHYEAGAITLTDGENDFENIEPILITANMAGTVSATFSSLAEGSKQNVLAQTLSLKESPQNITSASNPRPALYGRDLESDEELRARISNTYPQVLSVTRLQNQLSEIEGLAYAKVFFNYNDPKETNGVPQGQTAIVLEDGLQDRNTIRESLKRKIWEVIKDNSLTDTVWYNPSETNPSETNPSETNSSGRGIKLEYSFNDNPLPFYVVKPRNLNLKIKINAKEIGGENQGQELVDLFREHITNYLGTKKTGEVISNFEISKYLLERISFLNSFSLLNFFIKDEASTTDWGEDFTVQLKFDQKAVLSEAAGAVELSYNDEEFQSKAQ